MTLHQLRIALSIAKHRSLTKASYDHHISQPSVSQQIKLLEQEYGIKLYVKNGNGIEFTPAGQKFVASAKQILAQVDRLEQDCKGILGPLNSASLDIGGGYFASATIFPPSLKAFKVKHPMVQVRLETQPSGVIEDLVLKSKIELGVIIKASHYPSLMYEPLQKEKLVAVVAADHRLARKNRLALSELARAPIVLMKLKAHPRLMDQLYQEVESQGLTLSIALRCETPVAAKEAIKAGIGLGILFQRAVEPEIKRGELKVITIPELNVTRQSYIIYRKEQPLAPHAKDFLNLLRNSQRKSARRNPPLKLMSPASAS